nr:retrotransposon Orf1 [Tanacetum cinerariifolium]
MGDANPIRTLGHYSKPSHKGCRTTIELPVGNNVNDPKDLAKSIKAISLPQDVPSTSDWRLIELKNQVQCLMEAHLAPMQPTQVNKIATLCEICSGPHDIQYCMEDPEQAFVKYASPHTNEAGGNFIYVMDFMIFEDISSIIDPRLSQVVLGKPFVDIPNMTHDPPKGVVRFTNEIDEIAYKMSHKIEQYNSLSDIEKEHTKSVYLRNEEYKRRGVKYVIFDDKKLGSS